MLKRLNPFAAYLALSVLCVLIGLMRAGDAQTAPDPLTIFPGTNSQFSSLIRPVPSYVDARVLAASVAESQVVPAGSTWVLFSANCTFYAKANAAATVPGADTTNGSSSELNPAAWRITTGVISISVISPTACVITMSFYS